MLMVSSSICSSSKVISESSKILFLATCVRFPLGALICLSTACSVEAQLFCDCPPFSQVSMQPYREIL